MYLGKVDSSIGVSFDNSGLAKISKYKRTPARISFTKEHVQTFPQATAQPLKGPIEYSGSGNKVFYSGGREGDDKVFYRGGWEGDGITGLFTLGDAGAMNAGNPVAYDLISLETIKLRRKLEEMQKEFPSTPLIPEDHVRK